MKRPGILLAACLLAGGCAGGLLPAGGADPDELVEIKRRILELQRTAAMSEVEIDRLRRQVRALEARLGIGEAVAPAPVAAAPPSAPLADPEILAPAPVDVSDLEPVAPAEPEPLPERPPASGPPPASTPPAVTSAVPTPTAPTPVAPSAPTQPVDESAQALYDRGYTLYHQGRYVDAEAGFRRFLQAYPDTSLSDNAQYWIGESRFARGEYEAALAAFQEAAERYPGGNKVADSLLKAADCWQRLGDHAAAREGYDEVVRRFPGSAAAVVAEERRALLRR